jgi:hypothetical protein
MTKNNLGTLLPNEEELETYRSNLNEATSMLGRNGLYYQVNKVTPIGTDTFYEYDTPTNISYFLIENPKKTLLNRFGWNVEYDKKPIVCYFSFLDSSNKEISPTEGAIIELSTRINPHGALGKDTRKFQVVEAQTDLEMNMFIAKLAPYRAVEKPINPIPTPEDPENDDSYFQRKTIYSKTENVNT